MAVETKAKIGVLGASGYTGAELVRLIAPIRASDRRADRRPQGRPGMGEVFPHLRHLDLPRSPPSRRRLPAGIDLAFCALPHATSQEVIAAAAARLVKVVDLSADFRLRDPAVYERWYGHPHLALDLQAEAVYGLTEFYRDEIRAARLVAGTGCNAGDRLSASAAAEGRGDRPRRHHHRPRHRRLRRRPLAQGGDAAFRGVRGLPRLQRGEAPALAEFDQEFAKAAGRKVEVTFVPHLLPQNRGILATIYVRGEARGDPRGAARPYATSRSWGCCRSARRRRRGTCAGRTLHLGVIADRGPGG